MFHNIPDEMKNFKQWIVWKYEETQNGKPTKVPYCPHTGFLASVNEPNTWDTFNNACQAFFLGGFSGIGFVLTEKDPYTFIDLDNPFEFDKNGQLKYEKPGEILERQIRIHDAFASYSEKSPSGQGLHIIVKGQAPSGRRKAAVEVYSSARYMTMTGDVFNPVGIEDRQDLVSLLWSEMGGVNGTAVSYVADEEEKATDDQVLMKAAEANNGEKFKNLYEGNWKEYYSSQSEADYALINIIAFYTQNKNQIKRIFRASALGQRPKAKREDYVSYMINKSFDRMLPNVNMEGLREQMNAIIVATNEKTKVQKPAKPSPYTFPPGIVGEIAEFIYAQSIYPVQEISLVAALALMSAICGKGYNVSGTGLNNYFVLLAKTGRGKEAMAKGIDKIIAKVKETVPNATDFIGPAEFASPQGLVKHLDQAPCFMSVLTEFAMMLKTLTSANANQNTTGLRRMFLNLYNKSGHGQSLGGIVYSDRDKNTKTLYAPCFSFLGECTPEKYYRLLDEDLISEGLLPRFTTIEYLGFRGEANPNHHQVTPSPQLIQKVAGLASNSLMMISNKNVIQVKFDEESHQVFKEYNDKKCTGEINRQDAIGVSNELWTRSHVKAMKLAALVAIGQNPYHPVITKKDAEWAIAIIDYDNNNIISKFENGEISINNTDFAQTKETLRICTEYLNSSWEHIKKYKNINENMHKIKIIQHKYLNQRLAPIACFRNDKMGATFALKKAIQNLIDSGELQELPVAQVEKEFGTRQKCYVIRIKQ